MSLETTSSILSISWRGRVLAQPLRRSVDAAWDRAWSGGISNPMQCVEYLAILLLILRSPLAKELDTALAANNQGAVNRVIADAYERFDFPGLDPGSEASAWRDLATLNAVISQLREIEIEDRNADVIGDVFEYILARMSSAGYMGQFRTPRHVIQLIVDVIKPSSTDIVLDPACGTAGFLIAAAEFARSKGTAPPTLIGEEIDVTICRLARANVQFHGLGAGVIRCQDSLSNLGQTATVIMANPPFAGSIVPDRLIDFDSGSRRTEFLFLELMERRLEEGGRAGVVVPFGVLTSTSSAALWLRRRLIHSNRLRAVVELPRGVFRPYTDVRTALLFWESGGETETVSFIRATADGFSLDDRREPVPEDDLPLVRSLLLEEAGVSEHPEYAAQISAESLREAHYDLNPSRYLQPVQVSVAGTVSPSVILAELESGVAEFSQTLEQLEELV